jgi:hypothetical protein
MDTAGGSRHQLITPKFRKKKDNDIGPVKNVTISDARTGFVVLECVFRWPDHTNTANLGSLIQSFYQFAREVDDGGRMASKLYFL